MQSYETHITDIRHWDLSTDRSAPGSCAASQHLEQGTDDERSAAAHRAGYGARAHTARYCKFLSVERIMRFVMQALSFLSR
jgi:hypothetical protein